MDTLAHGLWGGVGFYAASQRKFASAFILGMAPDLLSFGLFHASHPEWIVQRFSGRTTGPPPLTMLPEFVFHAYNWTHSLVIWGALFALIWLLRKSPPWPLLAWGLHILSDIPTHGPGYFPTPYLWPLPTPYVQGIAWSTPWFMAANYSALLIAYLMAFALARMKGRRPIRKQDVKEPPA
ncbi:MAG: hypothetical protein HYV05_00975 [Deltaproteobacteria bacterium]|nr:hypothetical protein [Deltaproteobacteria bacterium]MBI2209780.1 hypothetical protein [Deltaproteobacteria bacterium]MBI2347204.1 hypothetical protein [Deltaproteobacteria bacterium]MBI2991278.1 hypothetical protein [Deltaproteobacteria bacterium]